jgi:hypothetical protein
MGQQQLLLIVLATIIIGITVIVGIQIFRSHSIDEKRNLIINEGGSLAQMAMSYYKKPTALGGGGNSFLGWSIPGTMMMTATGSYVSKAYKDSVVIVATGNEVVTGTDSVKVQITVLPNGYNSTIIN